MIKNSNIYNKNHIVIVHREKKSQDNLSGVMNVLFTRNYGRSSVLFGNFNLNTV